MKYYIKTYGCQMNVHESEKIAGILSECGLSEGQEQREADVIVFNTCCIRETAEAKIHGHIGETKRLKERNPDLIVGVCGCMSQQDGVADKLLKKFPHLDFVIGTANLEYIKDIIKHKPKSKNAVSPLNHTDGDILPYRTSGTNAWVNIMYGCNNFCTYCIVPYVRGRERSRPFEKIVSEVKTLLEQGYKEITLLGQNVNSYGKDFCINLEDKCKCNDSNNHGEIGSRSGFTELLDVIGNIKGKHRIRFMTSHPKDMSEDIIDVIAKHDSICKFIHLPVQSGSNAVLSRMNRKYTREQYLDLIDKIRTKIPTVALSSDVIVGFPGENEDDFRETIDLLEKVRFSGLYSFIYSKRKGTPAYDMEGQVESSLKRKRIIELQSIQNRITGELSSEYADKVFEVLIEDINPKYRNTYCGRTDCGRLVNVKSENSIIGEFVKLKIIGHKSSTLWGDFVNK